MFICDCGRRFGDTAQLSAHALRAGHEPALREVTRGKVLVLDRSHPLAAPYRVASPVRVIR